MPATRPRSLDILLCPRRVLPTPTCISHHALLQERVPRWFALTDKLAKGVAYVCDFGCTRAPDESTGDDADAAAPPLLPDNEAIPKMLIATLLLAIPRIAKQVRQAYRLYDAAKPKP
jgi:hypothetical protein